MPRPKPGFFSYLTAAFNARPLGMFVAPNWIGLGAFGLLGLVNPGFWVLGAGLELGYLLLLSTNPRFQRLIAAQPLNESSREWNQRIQSLLARLDNADRSLYNTLAERCRSIIDLQVQSGAADPEGLEAQADSLGRLSWMYLRLLVARNTIKQVIGGTGSNGAADLQRKIAALERQQKAHDVSDEVRRSLSGQLEILNQRVRQRADAEQQLAYIEAELERIAQQVELIREQAALSTDPELLSRRIDEIAGTLGSTGQWIREQQKVFGAMEDLLSEPPPLTHDARARESQ
jgi:chromosome segregation ATPase